MVAAWEAKKDIYSLVQDIAPKGTEFSDDTWGRWASVVSLRSLDTDTAYSPVCEIPIAWPT